MDRKFTKRGKTRISAEARYLMNNSMDRQPLKLPDDYKRSAQVYLRASFLKEQLYAEEIRCESGKDASS